MSNIYGLRNLEWRYLDGGDNNWFNTDWGAAGFNFLHPIYPSYGHRKGGIFDREDPGELSSTYDLRYLESRNVDGTGNHSEDLGAAGTDFLRLTDPSYADEQGVADPAAVGDFVVDRGDPRVISNAINAIGPDEEPIHNSFGASDLFTYFGQFIDHDVDIAPTSSSETLTAVVPEGDPAFTPGVILELNRTIYNDDTGVDVPREHTNAITSFADASNIYGSSEELTQLLRADGGASAYLLTSDDDLPPTLGQLDGDPDLVAGPPVDEAFVGGDVRINENIALTSMHTVWIREHNYQVDRLRAEHPYWSEDALFDAAKIYVEAEYQNIVFNEYLPLLVGAENIPEYDGYDPTVNPSISHEFATAAFRLGHSQLQSTLHRSNEDGSETQGGNLGLLEAFFQPTELAEGGGVDALVRGLASYTGQEINEKIVEDVRSFLFGSGDLGQDLATLNILRGRDHGLGSLNEVREDLGLARYNDFSELTSNPELAAKLAEVYENNVDNVGLWVGGLADGSHPDDKVDGSQLGSTFQAIIVDQFVRLRDGDSYYFEERLENSPELLAEIKATSFSDIILRNTGIDYLQDDAFIAHTRIGGTNDHDKLKGTDGHDLIIGFKGKDHLYGKEGDDDLYGGKGNDKLWGQDGDDVLNGEEGNDVLKGGKGADLLIGGNGRDVLEGGWGSDVFVFDFDGKLDKVRDFEDGKDLIGLNGISYDDLYVQEKFGGVLISYDGNRMYLSGLDSAQITADDFITEHDFLVA
jgi:peroxidase